MNKILLNISYTDNTGKFWQDSHIKNKIFTIKNNENIHDAIAEIIKEQDGTILSYNNKPQGNVFIDDKEGNPKAIGYIYRGKTEIYNDNNYKYEKALFDVWVEIRRVDDYSIDLID